MWLIVSKPTQFLAVTRLWARPSKPWAAVALYCAHLSLGDAWNRVFFGEQRIGLGAAVISLFFATLLASAAAFATIDARAGALMLPTCGWVSVALRLNWAILRLNRADTKKRAGSLQGIVP